MCIFIIMGILHSSDMEDLFFYLTNLQKHPYPYIHYPLYPSFHNARNTCAATNASAKLLLVRYRVN